MAIWVAAFAVSTILAAVAFVAVAVLWLKKLRSTLTATLSEAAVHQIHTARRLSETTEQMQRQLQRQQDQIHALAEANSTLRHELSLLESRVEFDEQDSSRPAASSRLVH